MKYIKKRINIQENGIYIVLGITIKDQLKLLHFSYVPFTESDIAKAGPECKQGDKEATERYIEEAEGEDSL